MDIAQLFSVDVFEEYIGAGNSQKAQKKRERITHYVQEIVQALIDNQKEHTSKIEQMQFALEFVRNKHPRATRVIEILEKYVEKNNSHEVKRNDDKKKNNIDVQKDDASSVENLSKSQKKRITHFKYTYGININHVKYENGMPVDSFFVEKFIVGPVAVEDQVIVNQEGYRMIMKREEFEDFYRDGGFEESWEYDIESVLGEEILRSVVDNVRQFSQEIERDVDWSAFTITEKEKSMKKITQEIIKEALIVVDADFAKNILPKELNRIYKIVMKKDK
ncbi:MAG: hypothetical protein CR972_02835 [Candidatus Moraniibacteriota bacterium]|nr:MAG: hypothetical protein CR972_02835 [Candidatus Moranbacteria bacterium]